MHSFFYISYLNENLIFSIFRILYESLDLLL